MMQDDYKFLAVFNSENIKQVPIPQTEIKNIKLNIMAPDFIFDKKTKSSFN